MGSATDPCSASGRYRDRCRYLLRSTRPFFLELRTRYIGVLYYYHRPIVLYYPLLGATLKLGRWPPPLGPPTDLMPGHLSPECGLTTLNDTHLRVGPSRRSSSLGELGITRRNRQYILSSYRTWRTQVSRIVTRRSVVCVCFVLGLRVEWQS